MKLRHDNAKHSIGDDAFLFDKIASSIASGALSVLSARDGQSSFVIGLEGKWGSGKTTLISFALERLRVDAKDLSINIISFDPWWLASEVDVQTSLLTTILAALSPKGAAEEIRLLGMLAGAASRLPPSVDLILKLSKRTEGLAGLTSAARKAGGDLKALINASKTPRELRDEIARHLEISRTKFIVVIDDLDRLSPARAVNVLSSLRSVGDLPGFVYLVAYDPAAIDNILRSFSPPLGSDFLEKVINISVPVPPVSSGQMVDFLTSLLPAEDIASLKVAEAHMQALLSLLDTPREAVRLANAFQFWRATKLTEVSLPDFGLLEAVRLKSPTAYAGVLRTSDIWMHKGQISSFSTRSPSDAEKESLRARLDRELVLGVDDRSQKLRDALAVLFPKSQDALRSQIRSSDPLPSNAISEPDAFFTYFFHSPLPGAPSELEVQAILTPNTSRQTKVAIISKYATAMSDDVRPFDMLISHISTRIQGLTRETVISIVKVFLEAGEAIRESPRAPGSSSGNFDSARFMVTRALKQVGNLSGEEVEGLISAAKELSTLAYLQLILTTGTKYYLLNDSDRSPLVSLPENTGKDITDLLMKRLASAVDDIDVLKSPMLPRLVFMASKAGREDIVDRFRSHARDPHWLLGIAEAYLGYADARQSITQLLDLPIEELTKLMLAAAKTAQLPSQAGAANAIFGTSGEIWDA